MIVKRKDAKGNWRYGVRGPGKEWGGTFPELGNPRKGGTAKWKEAQMFGATKTEIGPTCGEFARQWLGQDCPRLSGRRLKSDTLRDYRYHLERFIKDWDDIPLHGVERHKAFDWALAHKHDVQFVAALFSHALDLGLVKANPFAKLNLQGSRGRKDDTPLTEQEVYRLADASLAVLGAFGPTFRGFILFQAFTGMRPGETFELKWSDIEGDTIWVRRRKGRYGSIDLPKSNVVRDILLPPPAKEALSTFPRGLEYVFRGMRGKQLDKSSVSRYFKETREAAGFSEDVVLYSLRHFCGYYLYVVMGLPSRVVAKQLGHRDGGRLVETTYGHGEVGALDELKEAWRNVG